MDVVCVDMVPGWTASMLLSREKAEENRKAYLERERHEAVDTTTRD